MDNITLDRIKQFHPKLRDELRAQYIECNNLLPKGVRLRFAYTFRSAEEQDKLFKQRPKVTNSRGWQSIHQYGLAFDYVILIDKDGNGTFESIDWDINSKWHKTVVKYFKSKGWEWGGDWKSFRDYPHFQKVFGKGSWRFWKDKLDSGSFTIDGGIKYPNL